ncbi:MAG: DUF4928 family protein [Elusimicrobiota bacterium]|nr:DUF4928 family protein [Elusimicrobiota bacterium]
MKDHNYLWQPVMQWMERIKKHFTAKGFTLHYDTTKSLKFFIADIIEQAVKREKKEQGTMCADTVLQYMVGAKLSLVLGRQKIKPLGHSVTDGSARGSGDFEIEDVIIHVATIPSEGLLRKCKRNIEKGQRPIIITPENGMAGALVQAKGQDIEQNVDILDAGQFIAMNLYNLSQFKASNRKLAVDKFIERYNEMVSECETNQRLRIRLKNRWGICGRDFLRYFHRDSWN